MPTVKSDNALHAEINKFYIIHVAEFKRTVTVASDKGDKKLNEYYPQEIVSANTLSRYLPDEKMKISLFNDVLGAGADVYTRHVRKRLKIEFRSK